MNKRNISISLGLACLCLVGCTVSTTPVPTATPIVSPTAFEPPPDNPAPKPQRH